MKKSPVLLFLYIFLVWAAAPDAGAQVKQTSEVIEVYQVLGEYQRLLGEELDFDRAFEATFTRNPARRRAVAVADGEFGSEEDLKEVSDELLIRAYRQRMQIFYLMLMLAGAGKTGALLPLPPEIERIARRASPAEARGFPAFVSQLEADARFLRSFIERAVRDYPAFAKSLRKFKAEIFREKFEPPVDYQIKPNRGYYRGKVIKSNEDYYEISGYSLVKEDGKMKIVGIRFFTRLF
jgi:hypothetical protein